MKLARNRRLIIGLRCVEEVLRHCPERIECVYLASDSAKHVELRETAESAGVPVEQTDRKQLAAAAHSDSHQDIAACVPAAQSILSLIHISEPTRPC